MKLLLRLLKPTNLIIVFCLFTFPSAFAEDHDLDVEKIPIDMGTYIVGYPAGQNWDLEKNSARKSLSFTKQSKRLFGFRGYPVTIINVSNNSVIQKDMWKLSSSEIANLYRDGEISNMKMAGVSLGLYELHDVKKGTQEVDKKTLYTLSYTQTGGEWFGKDLINESMLYVYFPSTFKEDHTFYLFLISEVRKISSNKMADLSPIIEIIKSFRLK